MALQDCNCFDQTSTFFRIAPCPCPPSGLAKPWEKFQKLCTANFEFSENREEVESDQNRGSQICSRSINNGADYSPEFDVDFGKQSPLIRGVFGARDKPRADTTLQAGATLTTTVDTVCTTDFRFDQVGFECGMLVTLTGFGDPANSSDPADHGGDNFHFYMISDITFDEATSTSCLVLCTEPNSDWIPPLVDADTGGNVVAVNNPWISSDDTVFVNFQRVLASKSENIFQSITNALLSEASLTFTPNGYVAASVTGTGSGYNPNNPAFGGLLKTDEGCEDCCDTAFWEIEKQNVQLFIGCSDICVSEVGISVNRNPNTQILSCGNKVSAGRFEAEITATVLLGEGGYSAQWFDDVEAGTTRPINLRWYDKDLGRMEYLTFNAAQLLETPLNTEEGECVTLNLRWKATSECGKPLAVGGSTFDNVVCVENAFCFETSAVSLDVDITGAAGDVFIDKDRDDVSDQTGAAGSTTIPFTDGLAVHEVQMWDIEETPWTEIDASGGQITDVALCHLKALETVDLSGNELTYADFGNLPALTTIDVSNNPDLTAINVEGSFLVNSITATGTVLNSSNIEKLFCDLLDAGLNGGTVTLDPASIYSSLALTKRAELVLRGWTVTP